MKRTAVHIASIGALVTLVTCLTGAMTPAAAADPVWDAVTGKHVLVGGEEITLYGCWASPVSRLPELQVERSQGWTTVKSGEVPQSPPSSVACPENKVPIAYTWTPNESGSNLIYGTWYREIKVRESIPDATEDYVTTEDQVVREQAIARGTGQYRSPKCRGPRKRLRTVNVTVTAPNMLMPTVVGKKVNVCKKVKRVNLVTIAADVVVSSVRTNKVSTTHTRTIPGETSVTKVRTYFRSQSEFDRHAGWLSCRVLVQWGFDVSADFGPRCAWIAPPGAVV